MTLQDVPCAEGLIASITLVKGLTFMSGNMALEALLVHEGFPAVRTLKGEFPRVHLLVDLQLKLASETFLALITLEWLNS